MFFQLNIARHRNGIRGLPSRVTVKLGDGALEWKGGWSAVHELVECKLHQFNRISWMGVISTWRRRNVHGEVNGHGEFPRVAAALGRLAVAFIGLIVLVGWGK
jgi:hypothetical protein